MARSTRTRNFRQNEDWIINAIDRQGSGRHLFPSAFTQPTFSQGCRGFRFFEVARIQVAYSSVQVFADLFANWIASI